MVGTPTSPSYGVSLPGSGELNPAYVSWLHIDTASIRNPAGDSFTRSARPPFRWDFNRFAGSWVLLTALGIGAPSW